MAEQDEVVAFLEGGGLGGPVERIDTHASRVFLVGDHAFKLKRAVRFSFLDFGTLDRRHAALTAELALNRRTAPQLYRGLVAVTRRSDGRLELDGPGPVVEWLLEMVRFPADAQLDRLAARGALDRTTAAKLGESVARFHGRLAPRREYGGAAALRRVVAGNAADLRSLVPAVFPAEKVEAVIERIDLELRAAADDLEDRRKAGLVRHGHGDLHLANIVLLDGEPVPFDCLEFDPELATIDLLYDLAFLIMDLLARGLDEAALVCLQAWADARFEDDGLFLLPLFLAVRATIRAKVEGFTALASSDARGAADRRAAAARYLDLALRVTQPAPPRLVAVGGRSGTGKSSLARALAPELPPLPGAFVLRSDVIRKRVHGLPVERRLPAEAYTPEISERVFAVIAERAERLVRAGRSVVCDAVYGLPTQRARLAEAARAAGVPFTGLWLEVPQEVLEARVAGRVADASDADVAVVRRQAEHVVPPDPLEGWRKVSASDELDRVAARARAVLTGGA